MQGMGRYAKLSIALLEAERYEDLKLAGHDLTYRKNLYQEFHF